MRLIGILIAVTILSLLVVWWLNMSLRATQTSVSTIENIDQSQETQNIEGRGPIDYSKEKAKDINEMTEERAREYENY